MRTTRAGFLAPVAPLVLLVALVLLAPASAQGAPFATIDDVRQTIRRQMRMFADTQKLRPQDRESANRCNLELEKL